jgi:hypothetical protein
VVVKLIENRNPQGPRYVFKLLDLYKAKPNHKINKVQLIEGGERALIVYNGSKIMNITLNTEGRDI